MVSVRLNLNQSVRRLVTLDRKLTDLQAFFNVMLREFGVEGVKVQELFSLDEEMIDQLMYVSPLIELRDIL